MSDQGYLYGVFLKADHSDALRMFCLLDAKQLATTIAEDLKGVVIQVPIMMDFREKE